MSENIGRYQEEMQSEAIELFGKGEIAAGIQAQQTSERIKLAIDVANQHTTRDVNNVTVETLEAGTAGLYNVPTRRSSIDKSFLNNTASHMTIAHVLVHEEGGHHDSRAKGDNETISSIAVEEGLNEIATGQELGQAPLTYEREQQLVHRLATATATSVSTLVQNFQNGNNGKINALISQAANDNPAIATQLVA